jgi:small-conductance mechanosensitive channel
MLAWMSDYIVQIVVSLAILAFYFILNRIVIPRLESYVKQGELRNVALRKAVYLFRVLYGIASLAVILVVWGFNFDWLLALSSGIVALTGVALFAQWSMLSNITAFFILLVHESFKRGNFIRIMDGDNYVEGYIAEINIFSTLLISEHNETINYPNNLLITRPTIINPERRFNAVGKIHEFLPDKASTTSAAANPS